MNVEQATKEVAKNLTQAAKECGVELYPPHVTYTETEGCLEWWRGSRKITIWVECAIDEARRKILAQWAVKVAPELQSLTKLTVLRVWGSNIHDEMSDHILVDLKDFFPHYQWLNEGAP